jgi:DNA (cytosine-5)-methyltransferase 1
VTLRFGTVCSGIGAPEVAFEPLGYVPVWCSEIAAFPSKVLKYHRPHVPNHGDFTRIGVDVEAAPVDALVGGTPCQSFSIAGGRVGLDDPRGHLAVEFLRLARRVGPRWLVWENVADTLSVDGGDAFAALLGLMVECGYGVAWRILDAQGFGVPQRRRRVFVVGHLGDWRPSAAVLLERPSMFRHPRARAPEGSHPSSLARGSTSRSVANALTATHGRNDATVDNYVVEGDGYDDEDLLAEANALVANTLTAHHTRHNGGEDTFALAFHATQDPVTLINTAPSMSAEHSGSVAVFAFDEAQITHPENRATVKPGAAAPTLAKTSRLRVASSGLRPRRLTPRECERLQGFPDDYTLIPGASDSARYTALGNSMAVPVMRWIGRRILAVESIVQSRAHTTP